MIRRLIDVAPARLRPGGSLVFEIGGAIGCVVRELIARGGKLEFVGITPDYAARDRVVVARHP